MISKWLRESTLDWFFESHFQREPLVRPDTAADLAPLLTWSTVTKLVEAHADVLVVRDGLLRSDLEPSTIADATRAFQAGYSLVFRGCEEHDAALQDLAGAFNAEIEGEIAVQVFATPARHRSFGWHYDCEDVFIVQTQGAKDYQLRRNSVNPRPTLDAMPNDMQFELETSPVLGCTLIAGDWLYVPRGFWHRAFATEDSLSLSIGVLSPDARGSRPPQHRAWDRARSLPPSGGPRP
jgi:50S ribosomal protein L16 3-hydroxylase